MDPFDEFLDDLFSELTTQQNERKTVDANLSSLPMLAASNMRACIAVAQHANRHGLHAVSLSLVRQELESLTVIDIGLIGTDASWTELNRWATKNGRHTTGALRRWLERSEWSSLTGLWGEPWGDFMGSLSNALQTYAHFSPGLLEWNKNIIDNATPTRVVVGPGFVDPNKATRLQVLQGVLLWCLAQLMIARANRPLDPTLSARVEELGQELAKSEWLISKTNWSENLIPHLWNVSPADS